MAELLQQAEDGGFVKCSQYYARVLSKWGGLGRGKVSRHRLRYPEVQKRLFRDSYLTPTLSNSFLFPFPVLISEIRQDLLKMLTSAMSKAVNEGLPTQESRC